MVYSEQQEKQQQQQQQQQHVPVEKKKIKIKPKNTAVVTMDSIASDAEKPAHPLSTPHPLSPPHLVPQQKKKIIIIKKKEKVNECEKTAHHSPLQQNKKIIIIKKKEKVENLCYNDIAPPATMIYKPQAQNDVYYRVPPQRCCRFFIKNKHCFLRERDNACISPISRTVFGFWNEKVGKECKLLPVEDETTYEEEISEIPQSSPIMKSKYKKSPKKVDLVTKSPKKVDLVTKSPKNVDLITKSRFVSDAQRARVASEPVALLREKIAKQYGMAKKN